MTDQELLIIGAMVSFLAVAGAYVAMRHRANESPVDSFKPDEHSSDAREHVGRDNVQRPNAPPDGSGRELRE